MGFLIYGRGNHPISGLHRDRTKRHPIHKRGLYIYGFLCSRAQTLRLANHAQLTQSVGGGRRVHDFGCVSLARDAATTQGIAVHPIRTMESGIYLLCECVFLL